MKTRRSDAEMFDPDANPCPFCGCEKVVHSIGDELGNGSGECIHGMTCWRCLAHVSGGTDREAALVAWNRRTLT